MGRLDLSAIRRRLGFTQEDEDVLACQVISVFMWVFFVLLANFFLLHRSNTIPEAEAVWTESQLVPVPRPAPEMLLQLAAARQQVQWEARKDFIEEEHKPNYFFLYRDQVRFVDSFPKKKEVMVASVKPMVPPPPEKKEIEIQPEPEVIPVEWVEMAPLEKPDPERPRIAEVPEEARRQPSPEPVRVAMVKDLDMKLEISRDVPAQVVAVEKPRETKKALNAPAATIDLDMKIVETDQVRPSPSATTAAVQTKTVVRSSAAADFVPLGMEIGSQKGSPRGVAQGSGSAGNPGPVLTARSAAASVDNLPMSLGLPQKGAGQSRSGSEGTIAGESKTARLIPVNGKGVGGIDLGAGLISGKDSEKDRIRATSPEGPASPVRMILRKGAGQIALGAPLAFRLADVGDATVSGSAYLARSTQLKKFLDAQRLPSAPVTVPIEEAAAAGEQGDGLVGVSYSSTQIVLQFGSGKQQVVTLVHGEPFPRFELRLASSGARSVGVGTKLEEISACIQTLQHVLKE